MVICLERGADRLHNGPADATAPQKASFKSTLVLPFWYRLAEAVLEKDAGVVVVVSRKQENLCTASTNNVHSLQRWRLQQINTLSFSGRFIQL